MPSSTDSSLRARRGVKIGCESAHRQCNRPVSAGMYTCTVLRKHAAAGSWRANTGGSAQQLGSNKQSTHWMFNICAVIKLRVKQCCIIIIVGSLPFPTSLPHRHPQSDLPSVSLDNAPSTATASSPPAITLPPRHPTPPSTTKPEKDPTCARKDNQSATVHPTQPNESPTTPEPESSRPRN